MNRHPNGDIGLIEEFRGRFPLFERIAGRFGDDTPKERVPWFYAYLLAAASNQEPGACCFVLDKTAGTTPIAAILMALSRLRANFPSHVRDYADNAFSPGQRVKVRPNDFVFEYEGPWEGVPGFFRLKLLNEDAWRSFPLAEVLRLEPTDRVQPKGHGNTELGKYESSLLDQLLELTTCGNNSILKHSVTALMPRSQFDRVIESVILAPREAERFKKLSHFLPWGAVGHDGSLRPNDRYQVVGEPLIAVSGVAEDVAQVRGDGELGLKVVFADGTQRLTRSLQAFDDIIARQRLIILADPEEMDDLHFLRDRGCAVWRFSEGEILLGEEAPERRRRDSFVGRSVKSALIRKSAIISITDCHDEAVERGAKALEEIVAAIESTEEAIGFEDAIGRLFGILFECSESCFGTPDEVEDNLNALREFFRQKSSWISPEIAELLKTAFEAFEKICAEGPEQSKADALVQILSDRVSGNRELWAIATRSPRSAESLSNAIKDLVEVPVIPLNTLSADQEFDGIIVAAWPNEARFRRLRNLCNAREIRILAYDFEKKWVVRHNAKERARRQQAQLSGESRSKLIGVPSSMIQTADPERDDQTMEGTHKDAAKYYDLPVFKFEERIAQRRVNPAALSGAAAETRPARTVRFRGGGCAFMTEWSELSRLNALIDSGGDESGGVEDVPVSELKPGDHVLFRAGGDKEFVRLVAEQMVGRDEYGRVREKAERWKSALRQLGDTPSVVQRRLSEFGVDRVIQTIAGWLDNPNRIGPRNSKDIEGIAKAAEDDELLRDLKGVSAAISNIRGSHLAAGMRLSKLILAELHKGIDSVGEEPMFLDLGFGKAWIVQVDGVDREEVDCPVNFLNRLLWLEELAF